MHEPVLPINKILHGDALTELKKLPNECIDCCVTSPPYWGLRDYGTALWVGGSETCDHSKSKDILKDLSGCKNGQIQGYAAKRMEKNICGKCGATRIDSQLGLEKTPEQYVQNLFLVFREVKRVLKKMGTLWLNISDSYAGSGGAHKEHHKNAGISNSFKRSGVPHWGDLGQPENYLAPKGIKPKDLVGIPWMVAFALRADGWYLRSEIIWAKAISGEINIGTTMPESVQDRPTKSHETIFLLSKSNKYYYDIDAIRQELLFNRWSASNKNGSSGKEIKGAAPGQNPQGFVRNGHSGYFDGAGNPLFNEAGKNKRSVWYNVPANYDEAHFATFPEELIVDCIKAGCPETGIVLDPFIGAGTTGLVARKLNRNFIGIELNPEYIKIAEKRLKKELGMFL